MSGLAYNQLAHYESKAQSTRVVKKRLTYQVNAASSGGGIFQGTFISMNPGSAAEWSSWSSEFDEFRVLQVRITYLPRNHYNSGSQRTGMLLAYDNDSSPTVTSVSQVMQYGTCVFGLMDDILRAEWSRPTGGKNTAIPWIDVGSPSLSVGSVLYTATTSVSNSVIYGDVFAEYLVEFRGTR